MSIDEAVKSRTSEGRAEQAERRRAEQEAHQRAEAERRAAEEQQRYIIVKTATIRSYGG